MKKGRKIQRRLEHRQTGHARALTILDAQKKKAPVGSWTLPGSMNGRKAS